MARIKKIASLSRVPSKSAGPRRSGRIRRETEFYDEPPVPVKHRKRRAKKEDTPKMKKVKTGRVQKKLPAKDIPVKLTKSKSGSKRLKKKKKEKKTKEPKEKRKRHANDKLTPRQGIKVYTKDPTFETKEEFPFVSVSAYQKLAIRAVLLNSPELLKRLIKDTKKVSSISSKRSVDVGHKALTYAILNENSKMVSMIQNKTQKHGSVRVQTLQSLLAKSGTGRYNYHMLGHAVRNIQMGRGGREGNNAFLKDDRGYADEIDLAIQNNVSIAFMQEMVLKKMWNQHQLANKIWVAVRWGHRKLAGKMMEAYNSYSFNELHKQVLLFDTQKLKEFRAVSVKKKGGMENKNIFPLHCACINPNHKYLEALIAMEPDFNPPDDKGWRSMHYAAACEGNEPLILLIKKGASLYDVDKGGFTPFHVAVMTGRLHNVEYLAKELQKADSTGAKAFLSQKIRSGLAPIHLAAERGNLGIVKKLAELGADLEQQTGAGKDKVNALMMAAQRGDLETVKYLYEKHNVVVDKKDKLKRTALIHASLNGMAHVVSYLLSIGADCDHPDSSGNTPTHYAAAYGWYFCLKLLLESGADANKPNDWQLTPLAVAYLKGHMGLVDMLMNQPGIDIDCRDDKGMTLVDVTLTGGVDEQTFDQLRYLIVDKKARCDIRDTMGNASLHYLAAANTNITQMSHPNGQRKTDQEVESEKAKIDVQIAKLMIDNGRADPAQENDEKKTPFTLALTGGKLKLAELLVNEGSRLPEDEPPLENTSNALHTLADHATKQDAYSLLKELSTHQKNRLQELLKLSDDAGLTPFLRAIKNAIPGSLEEQSNLIQFLLAVRGILPNVLEDRIGSNKDVENSSDQSDSGSNSGSESHDSTEDIRRESRRNLEEEIDEEEDEEVEDDYDSEDSDASSPNAKQQQNESSRKFCDQGCTALHLAVKRSGSEFEEGKMKKPLLQFLLDECRKHFPITKNMEAFLELQDKKSGSTPLLMALEKRDEDSAILLAQAGSNVNSVTRRSDAAQEPESEQNPPSRGGFGLGKSIRPSGVRNRFLGQGISQEISQSSESKQSKPKTPNGVSGVMLSVKYSLTRALDEILKRKADLSLCDSNKDTALHYGCTELTSQRAEIVGKLLKAGAPVDQANKKLRTPLHIACNADTGSADVYTETVELLIESGANQMARDIRGRIPLHYAFVKIGAHKDGKSVADPIALVSVLLQGVNSKDAPWNIQDNFGQSPLHRAAFRGSNICCLRFLRNEGVSINLKDNQGNTPLGIAIDCGHKAFALTLLQANSDINISFSPYDQETLEQYEKKNRWKWAPVKNPRKDFQSVPIPSGVIRHEWQGVIYVIMDLMGNDKNALFWLLKAAIEHTRYNLALTLLRMGHSSLTETCRRQSATDDLAYVLAKHASMGDELQLKVFDEIQKVRPENLRNDLAAAAVAAAERGNLPLLKHMGSVHPQDIRYIASVTDVDDLNVAAALIKGADSITGTLAEYLKELHRAGASLNLPSLADFPVPADTADPQGRSDPSESKKSKTTILIRSIQRQRIQVCQFLIRDLGAKVDMADSVGAPIIHAVRTNNIDLIKLLLNKDYNLTEEPQSAPSPVVNNRSRRIFGKTRMTARENKDDRSGSDEESGGSEDEEMEDEEDEGDSGVEDEPEDMEDATNGRGESESSDGGDSVSGVTLSVRGKRKGDAARGGKSKKAKKPKESEEDFRATSGIDLNAPSGINNTTPLKACVSSGLSFGNWENLNMFQLLLKCGANPRHQELQELLREAAATGQKAMFEALKKLQQPAATALNIQFTEHKLEKCGSTRSAATPKPPLKVPDIDADAAAFLKEDAERRKREAEQLSPEEITRKKLKPHKNSGYDTTGDIVVCLVTGRPFAVLLNKVDISYGMFGFYNFYRLQLIKRRRADLYIVFTNWGRIGDGGQYQRTPFGKFEDALKEFKSIFKSKTGNDWASIENFQEKEKKYHLIEQPADEELEAGNVAQLRIDLNTPPSQAPKISKAHADFMKTIADVRSLQRNTKDVLRAKDLTQPFGRLSRERILKGMDVLQEIGKEINEMTKVQRIQGILTADRNDKMLKIRERMCELSNQFFRILPFGGMEHQQLQVIDDENDWRNKYDIVENLLEFEIAGKILVAAAQRKKDVHPLDYIYSSLDTLIQAMEPRSGETQTILHYIHNTAPDTQVQQVFKIFNEKENSRFMQTAGRVGNRKMLWHGTRTVNMLSILKTGLQAAPPHSINTGHLFGKGIYTADTFVKSAGYAAGSIGSDGNRFVLLCEVALGKSSEMNHLNIDFARPVPKGFDSIKGKGREAPDPKMDITLPSGAKLPIGRLTQQVCDPNDWFHLNYNEYIVFDPSQIIVRYVVVFK